MSQNSRNQCFSYYFCLVIEGSGAGSVSLTNGSYTDPDSDPQHWLFKAMNMDPGNSYKMENSNVN